MPLMHVVRPNFQKRHGLIVVIAQDAQTKEVLMQAYVDEAGYLETLMTGKAVYYSTSHNKRWMKGEESGDVQVVKEVLVDCDGDSVIYVIDQKGDGACHTKARSCFYRLAQGGVSIMPAPNAGDKEKLEMVDAEVHETLMDMTHHHPQHHPIGS